MKIDFNPIFSNIQFFPQKYAGQAVLFYLISLGVCSLLFSNNVMPLYLIGIGVLSVILFFIGSTTLGKRWSSLSEKKFLKNIIMYAIIIRLIHIISIHFMNVLMYDTYFESNPGDTTYYIPTAFRAMVETHGSIVKTIQLWIDWDLKWPDLGYMIYLAVLFMLMGVGSYSYTDIAPSDDFICGQEYIWLPLLLKAVLGAYTCVFAYKIAQRHFGDNVARMTAIFCMLQWNMIWWCGSLMKETEMVFLSMAFANRMDSVIVGQNIKPVYIGVTIFLGLLLFTFRSALCMVAFAATVFAMTFQSSKSLTLGKKIIAGIMIAIAMFFAIGDTLKTEFVSIAEQAQSDHQQVNMEWRSTRDKGNQFAKYATATMFAPLIFTLPFPSMVYTYQGQEMQMQVNGGNFEKNVLSFFVIFALFQLLLSGAWRRHVFPIAFLCGYLMALVLSEFAQSGRFHMPVMPFLMMFAAYGLTMVTSQKHKQWFTYALVAEIGFCVFWSWFKLKGQGLI